MSLGYDLLGDHRPRERVVRQGILNRLARIEVEEINLVNAGIAKVDTLFQLEIAIDAPTVKRRCGKDRHLCAVRAFAPWFLSS